MRHYPRVGPGGRLSTLRRIRWDPAWPPAAGARVPGLLPGGRRKARYTTGQSRVRRRYTRSAARGTARRSMAGYTVHDADPRAGRSPGVPGPRRVTSTRTVPSPEMTATVSPGAPDRPCRILLLKISLTSKTAVSRHGYPGPSTSETNTPGGPRPLRPPGKRHALPDRRPDHRRTRPSPPPRPRTSQAAGGHRDMHAQLRREHQADATGLRGPVSVTRPWPRHPSVAVRGKPTVTPTVAVARTWSAIRRCTPRYDDPWRDTMTHHGTKETARIAR